ncbi:hypothetical protein [Yoonia sediminilitoris]|uniref:Enoyl-CoA hydratase/isomerase-like protein n=1 Tax=Yoonia sediminilitoris TaxID=1286148 RepID=A0A2T6KR12_9RHOB|nr:hypothetical protein [Yoonia sediminilitoris]PUB18994.1 hypothetical protein C8N45_101585 [Yoonia sediminilitoris]RCW99162.1 hypothetical protein DFP92_101585 [Yoonia sediminilitoris]
MPALACLEDKDDRLVVVNANTAQRNALMPEYYGGLQGALALAGREARTTSVILCGKGGFAQGRSLAHQMDVERDAMAAALASPEAAEGIDAFLSKRAPDFGKPRTRS